MKVRIKLNKFHLSALLSALLFTISIGYVLSNYSGTPYFPTYLSLSVLISFIPLFAYFYNEYRKIKERERYFPQFLKDLSDTYRSGMSIVSAVHHLSRQKYGALTDQVKKLSVMLSWGIPFEEAFMKFAKETKSKMIESLVLIILESFYSGGNIADILDTVAEDARRLREIQEERKSRFSSFVATMYVVFIISLILVYMLLIVLLPEMPAVPNIGFSFNISSAPSPGGSVSVIPEQEMKTLFLHLLIIQAVVSGLMAGIIGEGTWTAGLKHVFFMSLIGIVFFQLFVFPVDVLERLAKNITKIPPTLSMNIPMGSYYVEKNITVEELKDKVESISPRHSDIDIEFVATPDCEQCGSSVEVNGEGVFIREPQFLTFTINSTGDRKYVIYVG